MRETSFHFLQCMQRSWDLIFCNLTVKTQQQVVSLFRDFLQGSPILTGLSSKCHNFFSIWSLLSLEKYVRQKYSLCLFSKKIWVCLFPTIFTLLFQKNWILFAKNCVYWRETDKLQKTFLNKKFECFRCFFIVVLKGLNLKRVMIVQAHTRVGENGNFLIFPKKGVI